MEKEKEKDRHGEGGREGGRGREMDREQERENTASEQLRLNVSFCFFLCATLKPRLLISRSLRSETLLRDVSCYLRPVRQASLKSLLSASLYPHPRIPTPHPRWIVWPFHLWEPPLKHRHALNKQINGVKRLLRQQHFASVSGSHRSSSPLEKTGIS